MSDREILTGKWGGKWEYFGSHKTNYGWHGAKQLQVYTVRSVRTGYVTDISEDSFVR